MPNPASIANSGREEVGSGAEVAGKAPPLVAARVDCRVTPAPWTPYTNCPAQLGVTVTEALPFASVTAVVELNVDGQGPLVCEKVTVAPATAPPAQSFRVAVIVTGLPTGAVVWLSVRVELAWQADPAARAELAGPAIARPLAVIARAIRVRTSLFMASNPPFSFWNKPVCQLATLTFPSRKRKRV